MQVFLLWTYYSTSATLRVSAPEHITFQSIRNKCLAVPLREHLYRYERIRFFCQAHCRYSDCGTARFKAFEMRVFAQAVCGTPPFLPPFCGQPGARLTTNQFFGQGQERASNFRKTKSRRILRAFFLDTSIDMGVHTYICVFSPL